MLSNSCFPSSKRSGWSGEMNVNDKGKTNSIFPDYTNKNTIYFDPWPTTEGI